MAHDKSSQSIYGKGVDPIATNQLVRAFQAIAMNTASLVRSRLNSSQPDPRRNLNHEFGYPEGSDISIDMLKDMYDREPIARRVVQLMPKEVWKVSPMIYELENSMDATAFENAWDTLGRSLSGESWYQDERGSIIWEYLQRVDTLSRIGRFGILLLGLDDKKSLSEPVSEIDASGKMTSYRRDNGRKLLYLRAFDESLVDIAQYESSKSNRRYGQPLIYNVTLNDPDDAHTGLGLPMGTYQVHWTRVIHVASNLGSSEIFGDPVQRPVFNRLLDLNKLYGGSAEMYYLGARPGYSLESHPSLGGDVQVDDANLRDMLEQFTNGLTRWIRTSGFHVNSMEPQISDPANHIRAQLEAICIVLGCPLRKFMGSEIGQLASGQDDTSWNDRCAGYQNSHTTPRLIVPFVDRLISLGVLPIPNAVKTSPSRNKVFKGLSRRFNNVSRAGYSVFWPDLNVTSEQDRAKVLEARMRALVAYITGHGNLVIPEMDFLTREMGYTEEEAEAILSNVVEEAPEEDDLSVSPSNKIGVGGSDSKRTMGKRSGGL